MKKLIYFNLDLNFDLNFDLNSDLNLDYLFHFTNLDVSEAMLRLQERKNVGKVILDVNLEPKPKPVEEEPTSRKLRFSTKGLSAKGLLKKSDKNKDEKKEDDKKEENKSDDVKVDDKTENKDEVTTNGEKTVEATA